jgi:hypothetical protein
MDRLQSNRNDLAKCTNRLRKAGKPYPRTCQVCGLGTCKLIGGGEMKEVILLALAAKWENDAITPECENGAAEARLENAKNKGYREGKRECADALKMLVNLLGDKQEAAQRNDLVER